ncbi:MAG: CDP-archaeol synthase [Candidatus Paceibacterota bacterium]
MMPYLLAIALFFLPAYVANTTPPLANRFNILNSLYKPIDNNKTINGMPILGTHKSWRGLVLEIIFCTVLTGAMFILNKQFGWGIYESLGFAYEKINGFVFGLIFGVGIVFGDLLFAFIKRRLRLRPGFPFIPFDQINYVIGAFIFTEPIAHLGIKFWIILAGITLIIHIVFNRLGYNMGLHKAKW